MLLDLIWNSDPVIFTLGNLKLRWSIIFLLGGILLGRYILTRSFKKNNLNPTDVNVIFNYVLLGALVGSRLFYFLLFEPKAFVSSPLHILFPFSWKEGFRFEGATEFSFTGALIGFLLSLFLYSKIKNKSLSIYLNNSLSAFLVASLFIVVGNFFQSENYGTATNSGTGVQFVNRMEKKLTSISCCVMRIPNGKNPLDMVTVKEGKVIAHEGTGYKPIIIYLFFSEGATEQTVNEFLIGDVKAALYELPELVFEPGNEPLHYTIFEEAKGKYTARIQTIGIARHPIQLYEGLSLFLLLIFIFYFNKKYSKSMEKISAPTLYVISTICLVHFGLGFITVNKAVAPLLNLSADQLICALLFAFSTVIGTLSLRKS